jgi:hypothetical protein
MKPLSLMFAYFLMMGISQNGWAKIWRINNTGVTADFTTVQAAVSSGSVVTNDTIHIEPSGTDYGSLTLTKKLVIIGNGYFLGSSLVNGNPSLQANTASSKLGQVVINATGSGSVIMGISCGDVYIGYDALTSNVVFKRNNCNTVQVYSGGTNNTILNGNNIVSFLGGAYGSHTNLVITNNIIGTYVQFDGNDNGIFSNNLVCTSGASNITLANFVVRNNIRVAASGACTFTSCTIQNNMDCASNNAFGNADGNLANIDMSNVFAGYPTIGSTSFDGRFALKVGSPAAGAGYGGADMGAILNASNNSNNLADTYVLSGMPNVPSVFKLDAPLTVNSSTMNVTVSTRTNN